MSEPVHTGDELGKSKNTPETIDAVPTPNEPEKEEVGSKDEAKTRDEKTAEKLGMTVAELKELKKKEKVSTQDILDRLEKIEKNLGPVQKQVEKASLREFFDTSGVKADFAVFEGHYDRLVQAGTNPKEAQAVALELMGHKLKQDKKDERNKEKVKAALPPTSDATHTPHKFPKLSRDKFSTLFEAKGRQYYKDYCDYWESRGEPLYT